MFSHRYLHVRLLLLRPLLSAIVTLDKGEGTIHRTNQSSLSHQSVLQCSLLCLQLAQEAINVIYKRRSGTRGETGTLSPWWYNVLFLYTSATVLIAARLSPYILAEVPESAIVMWWQQAIEALGDYSAFGSTVQHSLTTLQVLYDTVPQQFSAFQEVSANENTLTQRAQLIGGASETRHKEGCENRGPTSIFATAPQADTTELGLESFFLEPEEFLGFDGTFGQNDMSWLTASPFN